MKKSNFSKVLMALMLIVAVFVSSSSAFALEVYYETYYEPATLEEVIYEYDLQIELEPELPAYDYLYIHEDIIAFTECNPGQHLGPFYYTAYFGEDVIIRHGVCFACNAVIEEVQPMSELVRLWFDTDMYYNEVAFIDSIDRGDGKTIFSYQAINNIIGEFDDWDTCPRGFLLFPGEVVRGHLVDNETGECLTVRISLALICSTFRCDEPLKESQVITLPGCGATH